MSRLDSPEPSVRPRRFHVDKRLLIVSTREQVYHERTGAIYDGADLGELLHAEQSSILVCQNAPALLKRLDAQFSDDPRWQFRVSPVSRRSYRQHRREHPTEVRDALVSFLGWRTTDNSKPNRYHYPLDPFAFYGGSIRRVIPEEEEPSVLRALIRWGLDVREWCVSQGLKVNATGGGLGAQLLRDPRFYPEARRKVPRATNARARDHLPGNHYELFVPEKTSHDAYYVDMTAAHHTAARKIAFPDSNRLYARGRFRDPPTKPEGEPWLRPGRLAYNAVLKTHGLFLLRVIVPHRVKSKKPVFPPPFMVNPGVRLVWAHSNELSEITAIGGVIEGIEAAWTASTTERGLNSYAQFALDTLAGASDTRRKWLKPTLLSAYGMLAARPTAREFGFKHTTDGAERTYLTSGGPLKVEARWQSKETESTIVNVIHRGMIEAEVRRETLCLARELDQLGCHVLAVYADSVIIGSDGAVPLLNSPWRIKTHMTRVQFFNPTSFHSQEMTRLPGIPREGADRIRRLEIFRTNLSESASLRGVPTTTP